MMLKSNKKITIVGITTIALTVPGCTGFVAPWNAQQAFEQHSARHLQLYAQLEQQHNFYKNKKRQQLLHNEPVTTYKNTQSFKKSVQVQSSTPKRVFASKLSGAVRNNNTYNIQFNTNTAQSSQKHHANIAKVNHIADNNKPLASPQYSEYGFTQWKESFLTRYANHSNFAVLQRLLNTAEFNPKIIKQDKSQAEFVKQPWAYIDSAVSQTRVTNGRSKLAKHTPLFTEIEKIYAIDPYIITAIWGIESAYGSYTGKAQLASSLATLAYEGRRRKFAENQLVALAHLLEGKDLNWYNLQGSWAGGMGHTQFIPTTWIEQGIDADNDGKRNPWSKIDALHSSANYLVNSGWQHNLLPVYEASIRIDSSNDSLIGQSMTLAEWQKRGVTVNYTVPSNSKLTLWLPAGVYGPKLLTSSNFNVIKKYNNSSSYALVVSLLAQKIATGQGLSHPWPRNDEPLTTNQVKSIQTKLTNSGFNTYGSDGVIGSKTRQAFKNWQQSNGYVADGYISVTSARDLLR